MKNTNLKNERIGLEKINNQGCLMKIIDYENKRNIMVEFYEPKRTTVQTQYANFDRGTIKNPYYPDVFGVGCLGQKYPATINKKATKEYSAWKRMIERCYDSNCKKRHPTYKEVSCCAEWLCYENFYEWIIKQDNYKEWLENERWCLDKDILVKGNKIYSPETCCLVPTYINVLLIHPNKESSSLPIGVYYKKDHDKFGVSCSSKEEKVNEYFNNPIDAFYAYKRTKEKYIQKMAKHSYSKGEITKKCYEALMSYQVEITD